MDSILDEMEKGSTTKIGACKKMEWTTWNGWLLPGDGLHGSGYAGSKTGHDQSSLGKPIIDYKQIFTDEYWSWRHQLFMIVKRFHQLTWLA